MIQNKIHFKEKDLPFMKIKCSVLVGGCFDVFHYGHLFFLEQAKEGAKCLIVLLESDEFIQKRKHKKPVHTFSQRAEILSHIDIIDHIIVLPHIIDAKEYRYIVKMICPEVIAYSQGDPMVVQKKLCAKVVDARIKEIPYMKGFSSSLFYPYEISSRN